MQVIMPTTLTTLRDRNLLRETRGMDYSVQVYSSHFVLFVYCTVLMPFFY